MTDLRGIMIIVLFINIRVIQFHPDGFILIKHF